LDYRKRRENRQIAVQHAFQSEGEETLISGAGSLASSKTLE